MDAWKKMADAEAGNMMQPPLALEGFPGVSI